MREAESTQASADARESAGHSARMAAAQSLLERLKERDPIAQEAFYRDRRVSLELVARSALACSADAPALVSDVFTDFLFHYVDTIRDESAIFAYLKMMIVRRARRQNEYRQRHEDLDRYVGVTGGNQDAAEEMDARIWSTWLKTCLERLSDKARRLLRLHYGHEFSLDDIGSQIGVSKQAVSKAIQKSLGLLRNCLEDKRSRQRPMGEA
jgi:RNA polymerase sigma factor (sigma-70 family)